MLQGSSPTAEFRPCGDPGSIPASGQSPCARILLIGSDGTAGCPPGGYKLPLCKQGLCGSRETVSSVLVILISFETGGHETQFYFLLAFYFNITFDL